MSQLEQRIANATKVYSTITKWGLRRFTCDIAIAEEEPLPDLHCIICAILNATEEKVYNKTDMGIMLGFCLKDSTDDEGNPIYRDPSEEKIFNDIIEMVQEDRLIKVVDDFVFLTNLGRISIENEILYHFYKSTQNLYEHLTLRSIDNKELTHFPFYEDMGIFTSPNFKKEYWPEDEVVEALIKQEPTEIIERLYLQSKESVHIIGAEIRPYFDQETKHISIDLLEDSEGYFPVVKKDDKVALYATSLILNGQNQQKKEDLILECKFQQLWDDPNSILNYENLQPYESLINFEELTKDQRLLWKDESLLSLIEKNASPVSWTNISRYCDLKVLETHLSQYQDKLNWGLVSERVSDGFLLNNFIKYPWDLEVISNDLGRKISIIEKLILIHKDANEDWDWSALQERLSEQFVLSNLDLVKIDLQKYTKEDNKDLILAHPDCRWDWNVVESIFGLDFFLKNLPSLQKYLRFNTLFDRIFTDEIWGDRFAQSHEFKQTVQENIKENGVLSSFMLNDKKYVWTPAVIDALTELDLVSWTSSPYMKGLECNDYINWNLETFRKFSSCISSVEGLAHLSAVIKSIDIIDYDPSFQWDWDEISSNKALLNQEKLYRYYGNNLNWSKVIKNAVNIQVIQNLDNLFDLLGEDESAWTEMSKVAEAEFVKEHQLESWDWSILTERMFDRLKVESLGNPQFVNKWDWHFLSLHLETIFIIDNLERFKEHWDWPSLLKRLFVNSKDKASLLDSIALVVNSISNEEKKAFAWRSITELFDFEEIKKELKRTQGNNNYSWDYATFCSSPEFNLFSDLEDFRDFVDWDTLSSSSNIDKQLAYNEEMGIKRKAWDGKIRSILADSRNKWNFKLLSHFENLYGELWFLSNYAKKLDWDYLSAESPYFSHISDFQELNKRLSLFSQYISFPILSRRKDIDTVQVAKLFPKAEFDYNAMMAYGRFKVSVKDILKHPNYDWDWQLVCKSEMFVPNNKFLIDNLTKELDWATLSRKEELDAWSNPEFLSIIACNQDVSSQIDWYVVSGYQKFPVRSELLELLPLKRLNWASLSKKKRILTVLDVVNNYVRWDLVSDIIDVSNLELLSKYKDRLFWHEICTRKDWKFTSEILELFEEYIDWSCASASEDIIFSDELIDRFEDKWDWPVLNRNKAFKGNLNLRYLLPEARKNIVKFINMFPIDTPKVYHFTHMSNAVKIIKAMKLKSRNAANGHFENSAGENIKISVKAHPYARFYFTPKSPTQFYNEFLGKDSEMKRYYYKAYELGLPKCPLPVFFEIEVEELLMLMPEKCYYSNGNMQKHSTSFFRVMDNPTHISPVGIYRGNAWEHKDERQQEFLVKDEVDFQKLKTLKIYCADEQQKKMLLNAIEGSQLSQRVFVNSNLYEYVNKQLRYEDLPDSVRICTSYADNFVFRVSYFGAQSPTINNVMDVFKQKGKNIYLHNQIDIQKDVPFELFFEVDTPRIGSWLIYKNEL